jgi:glycosyltransferase involved in cell wall biosynthesis
MNTPFRWSMPLQRQVAKQAYRLRICGPRQFVKDAIYVGRNKRTQATPDPELLSRGSGGNTLRVLYVHSGWAIEEVGRLWFTDVPNIRCLAVHETTFKNDPTIQGDYDVVLFGYTWLMVQLHSLITDCDIWCVVHDPMELFPEVQDWKSHPMDASVLRLLQGLNRVIVTSEEMERALSILGNSVFRIPTDSLMPLRPLDEIQVNAFQVTVTTIGRVYRRKNFEVYKGLHKWAKTELNESIDFRPKFSYTPLTPPRYQAFLDESQIYLCTSYQEGGPIPPMDAMRRGLVVLTTPVGQMPERVSHGETGFICSTPSDFRAHLSELAGDPYRLHSMRLASLRAAAHLVEDPVIPRAVARLVG